MTETIIVAVMTAVLTLITTYLTMKGKEEENKLLLQDSFRDDLLQRIKDQNDRLDRQSIRIGELEEQRERLRKEFSDLIKQSEREVNNWRESHYMAMDQYNRLKIEHNQLKNELDTLRQSYEKLLGEYTRLTTAHS